MLKKTKLGDGSNIKPVDGWSSTKEMQYNGRYSSCIVMITFVVF